jgi:hypothetical protein
VATSEEGCRSTSLLVLQGEALSDRGALVITVGEFLVLGVVMGGKVMEFEAEDDAGESPAALMPEINSESEGCTVSVVESGGEALSVFCGRFFLRGLLGMDGSNNDGEFLLLDELWRLSS